jgi:DNA-binding XRE family transcriptional regulator
MFIPVRSLLPHRKVLKKPNVPQYEELPRTLGEHLRKKRMLSSLAQRVAAEMLGVTEDCVTGWENGRSEPQVQALSAHHRIPGLLPVRSRDQDARRRSKPYAMEDRMMQIRRLNQGWGNYFKLSEAKSVFEGLDEWVRSRIRLCYWKQWKKVKTRIRQLKRLGIKPSQAYQWGNTRKGTGERYIAQSLPEP